MTLSLLLFAPPGGAEDAGRVRQFHDRLTRDTVGRVGGHADVALAPSAATREPDAIDGTPVPALLARMRADDRSALAQFYHALFHPLWRVAVLQTHSRETAEDIVQDIFLWFWTRRATIAPDTDVRVYLSTAVRNRARNLGRHRQVADATSSTGVAAAESPGLGVGPAAPNAETETDDFLLAYRRALTLLDERELTAAVLRWEERFTLEQIASVLGLSPRGVLGVVTRAQRKVQDALKDFR